MVKKGTVKDRVLTILEARKGDDVSGEALADALGVSRAAVWKSIKALQSDGYPITAVTNRGYTLAPDSDLLSPQAILPHLNADGITLHVYDTVESTNKTAKELAVAGAPHGTVVLADKQTAGRGRLGRGFLSPSGGGIYMSLVIKPTFDVSKSVLITTAASVAVSRAVKKVCGVECQIKWVNDVYYDGKKICGILTEAITDFESGQIEALVLGMGINCQEPDGGYPPELAHIIGTVPAATSKNKLAAQLIDETMNILGNIDSRSFIEEYRQRSMVKGKEIRVYKGRLVPPDGSGGTPALALDIDDDGSLVVQYSDGSSETLSTGEISIRL